MKEPKQEDVSKKIDQKIEPIMESMNDLTEEYEEKNAEIMKQIDTITEIMNKMHQKMDIMNKITEMGHKDFMNEVNAKFDDRTKQLK